MWSKEWQCVQSASYVSIDLSSRPSYNLYTLLKNGGPFNAPQLQFLAVSYFLSFLETDLFEIVFPSDTLVNPVKCSQHSIPSLLILLCSLHICWNCDFPSKLQQSILPKELSLYNASLNNRVFFSFSGHMDSETVYLSQCFLMFATKL